MYIVALENVLISMVKFKRNLFKIDLINKFHITPDETTTVL